ncbi:MAG: hypothetical protein N2746_12330 [Deltaproteobacteria bacterium]|nr:hypothetical protein [Deltaproteobacteria bacterium]
MRVLVSLTLFMVFTVNLYSVEPWKEWYTIETEHFNIHFYEGLEKVANKVAYISEEVYSIVTKWFDARPSEKVEVVITDDTDSTNGFTSVVPYNRIHLFVRPPSAFSSLNDHDDWLYALFLHEFMHVVHLDMYYGFHALYNTIFGKSLIPNAVQPDWFIEGIATYGESRFSGGGRLRSSIYRMYLRTAVIEDDFKPIDVISNGTYEWPQGTIYYLYGAFFLEYIARTYGEKVLRDLVKEYAKRMIPYQMNKIAKKYTGRTYVELYNDFYSELKRETEEIMDIVLKEPITIYEKITDTAQGHRNLRIDKEYLYYYESSLYDYPHIMRYSFKDKKSEKVLKSFGGGEFDVKDGLIVYIETVLYKQFNDYTDLFLFNLKTGEKRRLTFGLRADYPALSPDNKRIAFVKKDLFYSKIGIMEIDSGRIEYIFRSPDYAEISNLRYSPVDERIVFSMWDRNERDIYVIDVKGKDVERITADVSIDIQPTFSPNGDKIYFASDRIGIYNIYEFDIETRELKRITNTLTGFFSPEVDRNNRIFALIYGSKGYDVCEIEVEKFSYSQEPIYRTDRFPVILKEPQSYKVKDYSSIPSILPKSWKPQVGVSDAGDFYGIKVYGSDSIGRNSFDFRVSYAPRDDKIFYFFNYGLRYFYPYLSFESYKEYYKLGDVQYINDRFVDYFEDNITFKLNMGIPLSSYRVSRSLNLTYAYQFLSGERSYEFYPNYSVPVFPKEGNKAYIGISYHSSTVRGYGKSISAEEGIRYGIDVKLYDRYFGSAFELYSAEFGTAFYIRNPLIKRHVNAFQLNYGISGGELYKRRLFYLGSVPPRDIILDFVDDLRVGGTYLRGYAPYSISGENYLLINYEYRFPILDIDRGFELLPAFFHRLYTAIFLDLGNAFDDTYLPAYLLMGTGMELRAEFKFGFYIPTTLRLGYSQGLVDKGQTQLYWVLGFQF